MLPIPLKKLLRNLQNQKSDVPIFIQNYKYSQSTLTINYSALICLEVLKKDINSPKYLELRGITMKILINIWKSTEVHKSWKFGEQKIDKWFTP